MRKRVKELEEECGILRHAISEAKQELEALNGRANKYLAERNKYMEKHKESTQLIEKMTVRFENERYCFEKKQTKSEHMIECSQQNFEDLQRYRNMQEISDALQNNLEYNHTQDEKMELEDIFQQKDLVDSESHPSSSRDLKKDSKSESSSMATWSIPISNSEGLEEIIYQLANTVNKMMERREDANLQEKIAQLRDALAKIQREREIERATRNQEIINLKQTILELEKALQNAQTRTDSLQKAVDLYQNSVNVLEASEERTRIEMSRQRQTILNLQEALVVSKHQLEELQQKASSEILEQIWCINNLRNTLLSVQNQYLVYYREIENLNDLVEYLRDANLDLEVDNFGFVQDLAMLETRLLKYQHICKINEECVCGLKKELIQLHGENRQYMNASAHLKQQLMSLTCELHAMKKIDKESKELQKVFQKANEELNHQAEIIQQELIRETKINNINAEHIEELQQIVDEKTLKLNQYENQLHRTQKKLDAALQHNKELKIEVAQLLNRIKSCQRETAISEERSDYCQKEIENCKDSLSELKEKLRRTKELLQQKTEQCNKLETEFCVQNNTLTCLKKQIEESKSHYDDDVADLKHTIQELNEKLTKTEDNYHNLHEDYKRSQVQIIEAAQHEAHFQKENIRREKEFTEKLQKLTSKEVHLNEYVSQLETECSILRNELMNKDRQLGVPQEELVNLKNELNKILHRHNTLKTENEKLQSQLCCLRENALKCEEHSHVTDEELNQCLADLRSAQMERNHLEKKNKQLKNDLQDTQSAYKELERKHQQLNESVVTLEMEVVDNKISRNEISVESRNVIANVRGWLQDQASINEQLTQKLRDDENLISKLKQQIVLVQARVKCCKCGCKGKHRAGGSINSDRSLQYISSRQNQRVLWNSGSYESGSISPNSIGSNNQDWDMYEEFEDEEYLEEDSLLSHCLKRVESINEELQKSNLFWQSKMVDKDYLVTRDQ